MTNEDKVQEMRAWLLASRYHRSPRFICNLLRQWLRRLLGRHCLVLVMEGTFTTHLRCQRCGRRAWLRVGPQGTSAGVERGCPLTDRLADLHAEWMEVVG